MTLISSKEAAKILGVSLKYVNLILKDKVSRQKISNRLLYSESEVQDFADERELILSLQPICKSCGHHFIGEGDGDRYGFCMRPQCEKEKSTWLRVNFDLLPDSNFKKKCEDDFWKVTPEQKQHFARFYELMRAPQKRIARKCRKCGDTMPAPRLDNNTYRLCKNCHSSNSYLGALAYASSM